MIEYHGMSQTVEYHAWESMKARCLNENNHAFERYGGRGIGIHPAWIDSFLEFFSYVGLCPNENFSLERIDNSGDYAPGNVRWETCAKQARNRRMQSRNKTGITGVSLITRQASDHYVAFWSELNGRKRSKSFSTLKYGCEQALQMAIDYRLERIKELNAQGAGYNQDHGVNY